MVFLNLLSLGVHLPRGDFLAFFILRKTIPFRQANGRKSPCDCFPETVKLEKGEAKRKTARAPLGAPAHLRTGAFFLRRRSYREDERTWEKLIPAAFPASFKSAGMVRVFLT